MNPLAISVQTLATRAMFGQDETEVETSRTMRVNPLESVAGAVRGRIERASPWDVAILGGVILFFVAVGWGLSRWARRFGGPTSSPERLFRDLCEAHRLDQAETRALRALAQAEHLQPAETFVTPEAFDGYPELVELKGRLFA